MRSTFARRSSAVLLAGALAFAGAACGDDEPETEVDVTEPAEGETTVEEETTTEEDMTSTETSTEEDMTSTETETEEATE